jgi:hypothetical protein
MKARESMGLADGMPVGGIAASAYPLASESQEHDTAVRYRLLDSTPGSGLEQEGVNTDIACGVPALGTPNVSGRGGFPHFHAPCALVGLVAGAAVLFAASAYAFPIDEFKRFVNSKPTVEDFQFRVKTIKSKRSDVDKDAYRVFALTYQAGVGFSLVEDSRGNEKAALVPRLFYGQYQGRYWHTFNSKDVVTAAVEAFDRPPLQDPGPVGVALGSLGIALDALNFGIFDLGENGVRWEGMSFTCSSNLNGVSLDGHLNVGSDDLPTSLLITASAGGAAFHYRATYGFSDGKWLPAFFPSRITLEYVEGEKHTVVSDYEILKLSLSDRRLGFDDVSYAKWTSTNSTTFQYSNNAYFAVANFGEGGHTLIPVKRGGGRTPTNRRARAALFLAFALSSIAIVIYLFKTAKQNHEQ